MGHHVLHKNMFLIFFQSGIVVNEIMCGDDLWHFDYYPPNFIMQCSALQKNIDVKCTWNINTYKTTFGTPIPCYFRFWAQFRFGSLEHHKHWFYLDDFNCCVGGFSWKYVIARSHVSIVWLVQHGVNFTQKKVSFLEEVEFLFYSKCMNKPQNIFRGELSISKKIQVPSTYTLNLIRLVDANNWPTSHCG